MKTMKSVTCNLTHSAGTQETVTMHGKACRTLAYLAKALLILLSLFVAMSALAEDTPRRYTVEMLIFSYDQQDPTLSEQWQNDISVELPDNFLQLHNRSQLSQATLALKSQQTQVRAITLESGETIVKEVPVGPVPLTLKQRKDLAENRLPDLFFLPSQKRALHNSKKQLERKDGFRVLFHNAWNMPIYDRKAARPILIQGGQVFDGVYELEGSIVLSVARYLHLDTKLYFKEFETVTTPSENGSNSSSLSYQINRAIPMEQSRRMRSRELHYIDHPKFGILIQLTPLS